MSIRDTAATQVHGQVRDGARPAARLRVARLRLTRLDPWSVMKIAFLLSIAVFIVLFVAVLVVWLVLNSMGVFDSVGQTVKDVTGAGESGSFDLVAFFALSRVLGFTTLVGLISVVLITALTTLFAFLYNLAASMAGGVEVTLADADHLGWGGSAE